MKKLFSLLVALSFLLASCGTQLASGVSTSASVSSQLQGNISQTAINIDDKYTAPQETSVITFSGDSASYKGDSGVNISGSTVTITKTGTYTVSGTLTNGQLIIDAADKGAVNLVLNNAEITCNDSAAIWIKQASETVISLVSGTQNTLISGADASTTDENAPKAALFSSDDIWLCGSGTLKINAEKGNGVQGKDTLTIANGNYNITAGNNGIVGKDSLVLADGVYEINAGNDGVKSTNANDANLGTITVLSGDYSINAEGDGFQAETVLNISGGSFEVITGGGAENATQKTQNEMFGRGGEFSGGVPPEMGTPPNGATKPKTDASAQNTANVLSATSTAETTESDSFKAFKAVSQLNITGGSFNINSCDDAFHSNDSLSITAGDFNISTGDDALHADNDLSISGGNINVAASYEGVEATNITISGGEILVVSSDDGINAAGGDGSGQYGFAADGFKGGSSGGVLTIRGGDITVNAKGDGIDINGSGEMTGGTLTVYGPQDGGNGAFDYDKTFNITGGTLISFGSAQMALTPTAEGCSLISVGGNLSAGQTVKFVSSDGTQAEYITEKAAQQILFTSPQFKSGDTVTVYLNGTQTGQATLTNGVSTIGTVASTGGGMGGNKPQRGAR